MLELICSPHELQARLFFKGCGLQPCLASSKESSRGMEILTFLQVCFQSVAVADLWLQRRKSQLTAEFLFCGAIELKEKLDEVVPAAPWSCSANVFCFFYLLQSFSEFHVGTIPLHDLFRSSCCFTSSPLWPFTCWQGTGVSTEVFTPGPQRLRRRGEASGPPGEPLCL